MTDQAAIKSAFARIQPHIRKTPVLQVEPGQFCANSVALKLEHTQITGSFKLRGAFNSILNGTVGDCGVVAISGGNHGAAVAYAATKLGHRSTVYVPVANANAVKIARMENFGAEVRVVDKAFPEVMQDYLDFAKNTGALAIHPFDAPDTLGGQGTMGMEIDQQLPDIDTLFVSVGGGGLIGGITSWFGDKIKIVAVETEQTASYAKALSEGRGAAIIPAGIAASALGGSSIGDLPWEALQTGNVHSVVVSDDDVFHAGKTLWDCCRLVGEPGAATTLAPLTSGRYKPGKNERVAVVLCGGNAEPNWFEH